MNIEEFRKKLKKRAAENRKAFEGHYAEQINGLLGLSKEEIDSITPDATDLQEYDKLILVVKEASAANLSQAKLKKSIIGLGEIAIDIAKRVPSLHKLLE